MTIRSPVRTNHRGGKTFRTRFASGWRHAAAIGLLACLAASASAQSTISDDSGLAPVGLETACLLPVLPVFDVTTFGAVGDGATDDTVAIRRAIAAAVAVSGGIVYFPQGTYAVCRQTGDAPSIVMPAIFTITSSNLVFLGEGSGRSHLSGYMPGLQDPVTTWVVTTDPYFKINRFSMFALAPRSAPVTNVQFRSLDITGNAGYTGNASVGGVPATGDGWDMSHKGIALVGSQPSDVLVFNCSVRRWRGEVIYGGGNQGRIQIINTSITSSNASAVSISGDVLLNHSQIGGPDPGDDVYNGVENFCIGAPQKTVIQDCTITAGSDPARPHGNGVAYLGLPTSSFLIERCQIRNNSAGILFSEFAYNVIVRDCSFMRNTQATITSILGMYAAFHAYEGFGDFLYEDSIFDRTGSVFLNQSYGGTKTIDGLVLQRNTVTNGSLIGGAFSSPLTQPYINFIADGNILGSGAVDYSGVRTPPNPTSVVNFARWTNTVRANVMATAAGWLNRYDHPPGNTALMTPASEVTVLNDHPSDIPVLYATMSAMALPGYPTGFTTTILCGSSNRAWGVRADPTWNTFPVDQVVGASGLTMRKNSAGTFDLVTTSAPVADAPPTTILTSPAPGGSYATAATLTVTATATDSDGTIARVEFYIGSMLVGVATAPPYTVLCSGLAAGTYPVTAKAVDNLGMPSTSAAVTVTITGTGTTTGTTTGAGTGTGGTTGTTSAGTTSGSGTTTTSGTTTGGATGGVGPGPAGSDAGRTGGKSGGGCGLGSGPGAAGLVLMSLLARLRCVRFRVQRGSGV